MMFKEVVHVSGTDMNNTQPKEWSLHQAECYTFINGCSNACSVVSLQFLST